MKHIWIAVFLLLSAGVFAQQFQLAPPQIRYQSPFFEKSATVTCMFDLPGAVIHYTLDGSAPTRNSSVYHRPLQVRKSSVVRAIAVHPDYQDSEVAAAGFVKITPMVPSEISLDMPASPKYPAQGAKTLADHKKGGADIHDGNWLGFEGTPAGLTMHFDKDIQPSNMTISALVATGSWIFPPQSIEVLGSLNGREFFPLGHMKYDAGASAPHPSDGQNFYTLPLLKQTVRHLKVVVHPYGQLPDWHPGAGKPAWLFLDEIIVE